MSSLIEMHHITKTYHAGDNAIDALSDLDFTFHQGEFVAVVGESGAGKSTLVSIVGLLDRATSGSYLLDGEDVSRYSEMQLSYVRGHKIGFIFQSYFLLPKLNAIQNVAMPLLYRDVPYEEAYHRAQQLLDKLNVGRLAKHKPSEMSGGQQQRVAIARALVGEPKLLLADEPTGALDSKSTNDLMSIFLELHGEGTSILMITHDLEISQLCQRRVKILDGKIYHD